MSTASTNLVVGAATGPRVTLVHGAHATYDGAVPAQLISRRVEEEFGGAGVSVVDCQEVTFL